MSQVRVLPGVLQNTGKVLQSGRAGDGSAGGAKPQRLPPRPRRARSAGSARCGRHGVGPRAVEHRRAAIRGGGPVVGWRDHRGAVRGRVVAHAHVRSRSSAAGCDSSAAGCDGRYRLRRARVPTEERCSAGGVAGRTYRRARLELLASGEPIALEDGPASPVSAVDGLAQIRRHCPGLSRDRSGACSGDGLEGLVAERADEVVAAARLAR
jgi:hypothetical protein